MEKFLEKKELVSWSVNEEFQEIDPNEFTSLYKEELNSSVIKAFTLPDGRFHGNYERISKEGKHFREEHLNYRFGELHGSFSIGPGTLHHLCCEGTFERGKPQGELVFWEKSLGNGPVRSIVFYEKGLPISFTGEKTRICFVWNGNTVELDGEKYTDVVITKEYLPFDYSFGFSRFTLANSLLSEYISRVYATDKKGERVLLRLPVF
nr:hypothetical protein MarFTME_043 [Marseillevirus futianmevirus]